MASKSGDREREEPKLVLGVGHPRAGYLSPDMSYRDGGGDPLPEHEEEYRDEMESHLEEERELIGASEDVAVKEEREAMRERMERMEEERKRVAGVPVVPATTTTASKS